MNRADFFKPQQAMGIYIGRSTFSAVHCQCKLPKRLLWQTTVTSDVPFEQDETNYAGLLDELFTQVRYQSQGDYIPVSVMLAEPWVKQTLLSFDTLPKNISAVDKLIHWRLEKDWHLEMDKQTLRWQILGQQQGQQWVLAQTCSSLMVQPLIESARKHQVLLDNLDAAGSILLNRISMPAQTTVIIVQPDYWSLSLLDQQGWPRYHRSKWYTELTDKQAIKTWVAQIDRMLSAFQQYTFEQVMLMDGHVESDSIAESLQARFNKPTKRITDTPCRDIADILPDQRMAMLAMEAA